MKTRIQQIKQRLEARLDKTGAHTVSMKVVNQDIADLLAVVEVYEDCLTKIEVELGEDDDNIYIAEAREALTKAKEIFSSSES